MAFRKYGGLNYAATNNIIRNHYQTSDNFSISDVLGQYNSKIVSESHLDMSGNSLLQVESIYFMNGNILTGGSETGNFLVTGNLTASGTSTLNNVVSTGSDVNVGANLIVNGTSTLNNNVQANSNLTVGGNLTVKGTSALTGAVSTGSNLTVGTNLIANGTSALTGAVSTGSSLTVTGTSTLTGAVSTGSSLTVSGTSTLTGSVTTTNDLLVGTDLSVTEKITVNGYSFLKNNVYTDLSLTVGTDLTVVGGNIYGVGGTLNLSPVEDGVVNVPDVTTVPSSNSNAANTKYVSDALNNSTYWRTTQNTTGTTTVSLYAGNTSYSTVDVTVVSGSFSAISDHRVKENVKPLNDSITVDHLKPVIYTQKETNKTNIGFLAHEVQEIFPFLVEGEKDGTNLQSVNYIGLIGLLTKEIQELKKRVEKLEIK